MNQEVAAAKIKVLLKSIDSAEVDDKPYKLGRIVNEIIDKLALLKGTELEESANWAIKALEHTINKEITSAARAFREANKPKAAKKRMNEFYEEFEAAKKQIKSDLISF